MFSGRFAPRGEHSLANGDAGAAWFHGGQQPLRVQLLAGLGACAALLALAAAVSTCVAPRRFRSLCGAAGPGSRGLYACSFSQGSVCMRRCCWPWQWLSLRVQLLAGRGRCAALLLAIEFFLRYAHFKHAGPNGYLAGCWDWHGAAGGPSQSTHSTPWLPKPLA